MVMSASFYTISGLCWGRESSPHDITTALKRQGRCAWNLSTLTRAIIFDVSTESIHLQRRFGITVTVRALSLSPSLSPPLGKLGRPLTLLHLLFLGQQIHDPTHDPPNFVEDEEKPPGATDRATDASKYSKQRKD